MIMGLPESEAADPQPHTLQDVLPRRSRALLGARISRNKNIILFLSPGGRARRIYYMYSVCVRRVFIIMCAFMCSTRLHFHISYSAKQKTLSRVISPLINNDQEQKIAARPMPIISSLAASLSMLIFCARHPGGAKSTRRAASVFTFPRMFLECLEMKCPCKVDLKTNSYLN
jgi:hypothetical protein